MKHQILDVISLFFLTFVFTEIQAQTLDPQLKKLSDASNDSTISAPGASNLISYETALKQWKTVLDVNNWIKDHFRYSMERAKQLADNSPTREKTSIYAPIELFHSNKGVCIDLSRFAVETINTIDTSKHAQYLLIEFEPIIIDSSVMKNHWMTVFHDSSGYFFLADSKRPGQIAGPYQYVDDFISEYQLFRGRKIISWKVLPDYTRKQKKKATRQNKENSRLDERSVRRITANMGNRRTTAFKKNNSEERLHG